MIKEEKLEVVGYIQKECVCDKCNTIMQKEDNLYSNNPPQYKMKCEKCGNIEFVNCDSLQGRFILQKKEE